VSAATTKTRAPARKSPKRKRPPAKRRTPAPRRYSALGMHKATLVAAFARKHLIHVDGELPPNGVAFEPIDLAQFQLENIIYPIFADVDKAGRRRVKKALVGLARDGAKSEIAAVIVLAIAFLEPKFKGQYYFVARDREQARAVFDKVSTMVLHDPLLRRACDVMRDVIVIKETKAKFQVLPGDEKSVQSKHADVCIIDEYHVHKSDAVLNAMTSGMIGNWDRGALLLVISTAGPERKGPLWELLKRWTAEAAEPGSSVHVYWCGARDQEKDDGHDPNVWRAANPMHWVSDAALAEAYIALPFPDFERYHLNRFPSTGTNRAYSGKLWHACAARPAINPDLPSAIGLDASWTRDTTALVFDQVDAGGYHNPLAWIWHKDESLGYIDHDAVEAKIIELCEDFNVMRIGCDPNYFTRSMLRLQNEHGLPIEEFKQNDVKMSAASMMWLDVLKEGRCRHGGNPELTDQVLNAGVKETPYGWRLTRVQNDLKIDAAVALVMAAYLAEAEAHTTSDPHVITTSRKGR
jgi:phage terminase large subunit-like protein